MVMIRKIVRIGNSYGIVLTKDILRLTGLLGADAVELKIKRKNITLSPIRNKYSPREHLSRKRKKGIVVGRFQPFHNGHAYLIKKALEHCEKIVIAIGVSIEKNTDSPFSSVSVKQMVDIFVKNEGLDNKISKIIFINDVPDDDVWRNNLIDKCGELDVVIGDNEWVNGIFENVGKKVIRIGYFNRNELEGKKIRRLIVEGKKWQNRVPKYLIHVITL